MNDQVKERLEKLADFIDATEYAHPLSSGRYLWWRSHSPLGYGFSVLGLICQAHKAMTGNGRWTISAPQSPELPDYLTDGEMDDTYLPQPVVDYFGFRDKAGSFSPAELPQDVKRLLNRTRKSGRFSLRGIGMEYRKRGREIAVKVIRAMPPSLLKSDEPPPHQVEPRQQVDLSDLPKIEPRPKVDLPDLPQIERRPEVDWVDLTALPKIEPRPEVDWVDLTALPKIEPRPEVDWVDLTDFPQIEPRP